MKKIIIENPAIFIHGQESSSGGTKGLFFRGLFPEMIIPDFVGDVSTRMSKLNKILLDKKEKGITMIGSSLGACPTIRAYKNLGR